MRRFFFITLLLAATITTASANPTVNLSGSIIAIPIVIIAALVVEAGLVALLLTIKGLLSLRVFFGYGLTNLAVYLLLFLPLFLMQKIPLMFLEALVVVVDASCIKLIARFESIQGDEYQGVGWRYAFVTAVAGNAVSYLVGLSMRSAS